MNKDLLSIIPFLFVVGAILFSLFVINSYMGGLSVTLLVWAGIASFLYLKPLPAFTSPKSEENTRPVAKLLDGLSRHRRHAGHHFIETSLNKSLMSVMLVFLLCASGIFVLSSGIMLYEATLLLLCGLVFWSAFISIRSSALSVSMLACIAFISILHAVFSFEYQEEVRFDDLFYYIISIMALYFMAVFFRALLSKSVKDKEFSFFAILVILAVVPVIQYFDESAFLLTTAVISACFRQSVADKAERSHLSNKNIFLDLQLK